MTLTEYNRAWRAANPEKCAAYTKKYRDKDPVKYDAKRKGWRALNLLRAREYHKAYAKKRRATDPSFKLASTMRCRIGCAIREGRALKSGTTTELVGCATPFLLGYLEAKFKPGMSWVNYGSVWEVDHIIPCSSYDLTDPSHQKSCFHYSNLQPLFVSENRKKSNRLLQPHKTS